jgi:hypothetical protein
MKKPMRLLLASAALIVTTVSSQCLAQSVTVPFVTGSTGAVIANGGKIILTSGSATIAAAPIYTYSVSGSLVPTATGTAASSGTNAFIALLGGTGAVSLNSVLALTDSNIVPYLQGTVLNVKDKLPFTLVNHLGKGALVLTSTQSTLYAGDTLATSLLLKNAIGKTGIVSADLTNISFLVKVPKKGSIKFAKTDSLTFVSGGVTVTVAPLISATSGAAYQPDLAFITGTGLDGLGTTGTSTGLDVSLKKGKTASFEVLLQNSGTSAATFALSSPALSSSSGFVESFVYAGKSASVTGSNGFIVLPGKKGATTPIGSGDIATLIWKIKNAKATSGATVTPVLTAVAVSGTTAIVSGTDSLFIQATAE